MLTMETIRRAEEQHENAMWQIFHDVLEEFEKPEAYCHECGEKLGDLRPGKRDDEGHYHCEYCLDNNLNLAKKYLDEEFYENIKATVDSWRDWED